MSYFLNRTEDYHRREMKTLVWELTVCNTLEFENSPVRKILVENATYGEQLADHLFSVVDETRCRSVLEIGGGYGFLMRDLLKRRPGMKATMVDISPVLMKKQMETLENQDVRFVESDFFDLDKSLLQSHDLAILNEMAGDLPTACNLTRRRLGEARAESPDPLGRIKKFLDDGFLELPDTEPFNVNIGAMEAVDLLCSLGIPHIFISEHSCEADVTDGMRPFMKFSPGKNPEEIKLIGHSEYSLCFANIESIARGRGYRTISFTS